MTVQEMLTALKKIKDKSLTLYACCGSDGCSYDVGSAQIAEVSDGDDAGPLCELPKGTKYVSIYIGN